MCRFLAAQCKNNGKKVAKIPIEMTKDMASVSLWPWLKELRRKITIF